MEFSENTRVKIPALVHATRLGYNYISLKKDNNIDEDTNIFKNLFKEGLEKINNREFSNYDIDGIINELKLLLSNEDLGKSFYKILINGYKGIKLINFEVPNDNLFNITTELTYKNGEEEFRPDIIMLINGMPLSFIEVKKPNNRDGIIAERNRINTRFHNSKFRKFVNLTQLVVFSNNQEYNEDSVVPIEGAFYGTPSYDKVFFNCFREEQKLIYKDIKDIDFNKENEILKDNNYASIKGSKEYSTNLNSETPTNRIITSLFHKKRILEIIKYGIAYVEKTDNTGGTTIQKHIMRYQQFFASLAIEEKLELGEKKGVIWHTQGSGKTALSYFNVKRLSDYFQKKGKIAKFYFIVDRLDLLKQASEEFIARGMSVVKVNSREEFKKNIAETSTVGADGQITINVVNIQKFTEESCVSESDYNVNVQRIYFLDEAHRSYNPKGSFLGNLISSDKESIIVALTGTPLIGEIKTKYIFGDYIHKYYYNKSISDGYTLKLIREGIETSYKTHLQEKLTQLKDEYNLNDKEVIAHPKYTKAMAEYIVKDFKNSRIAYGDESIGGMIVCDSQQQARNVFEDLKAYDLKSALILHNEDDKVIRTKEISDFKKGILDLLVVQNMLLTGFDAPRLKKLYLNRNIKEHNLLQTLTRVNRPYKNFRFGYVVDFADIREEFDKTNENYFKELKGELEDDFETYNNIFLSQEEIKKSIIDIEDKLFQFDTDNLENFSSQVTSLNYHDLLDLKKVLNSYKDLFNVIKAFNYSDIKTYVKSNRIGKMIGEVDRRLDIIKLTEKVNSPENDTNLLNVVLSEVEFNFKKISEEELVIADKYKKRFDEVRIEFLKNFDKDDKKFINLYSEFKLLFKSINFEEITTKDIEINTLKLEELMRKIKDLNNYNDRYLNKYSGDEKYVRIHKRVKERVPAFNEVVLNEILIKLKEEIDDLILRQNQVLDNESYFEQTVKMNMVNEMEENNIAIVVEEVDFFTEVIVDNYLYERRMINND